MSQTKQLAALRSLAVCIFGYSIYFQIGKPVPHEHIFGRFKYLTHWDLLIQFGFFTILLVGDSILRIKSASFTRLVDFMLYSLAYPVAALVSIVFWGLYAIDRELIFPVAFEKYCPPWLNHSIHTLNFFFIFFELLYGKHRLKSKAKGLLFLNLFLACYLAWLFYIAFTFDHWVYPFLSVLDWPQRIAFFTTSILSTCLIFYSGVYLNSLKIPVATKALKRK